MENIARVGIDLAKRDEFERRATAVGCPMGTEGHREPSALKPFRIEQPRIHKHPLSRPPTPVSEEDSLPSAIVHFSAGDDSPQPSTRG